MRRQKDGKYVCVGCVCSPACAKRYALDRMGSHGIERCAMVSELCRLAGCKERIRPAPPFMSLQSYGGPLTLEEYRRDRVEVSMPPVYVEYLVCHR